MAAPARSCYIGEWTAIKLRWSLAADPAEKTTLTELAADCPNDPIQIEPVPLPTAGFTARPSHPGAPLLHPETEIAAA